MKNTWDAATDRALAEALSRGEEQALATIMRDLGEDLRNHAYRFIRSRDLAEDIVQDVLCKLWIQRDTWTFRDSLRGYLYGAVRNRALDELAHRTVEETAAPNIRDSFYTTPETLTWPDRSDGLSHASVQSTIHRVLVALHPRVQAAVLLRIDYGLRYVQIARMLNMSIDTVRQHLTKFRRAFREALSGRLPE